MTETAKRSQNRAAHITINSDAFRHNLDRVRGLVPNARIMAVIKADGCGHGMEAAAEAMKEVDEYGVTGMDDARRLRTQGFSKPLTLLSSRYSVDDLQGLSEQNIRPVIYDLSQLSDIYNLDQAADLDLWLKVDCGMGRLGLSLDEAKPVISKLQRSPGVRSVSLMGHLANADTPEHPGNHKQFEAFFEFFSDCDLRDISLLNSAGVMAFPERACDMVRPGLMLYGISPLCGKTADDVGLMPVMNMKSELIAVRAMPAGSAIGYGSEYTLDADSRIGVVACGYGDGYPRHAPSGTPVLVNGMLVPLIGRVSMDLLTVDLGEVPARVGDEVVLWGEGNPIEIVAEMAGTIGYELTCGVTARVERLVI